MVDSIDIQILRELQKNARLTVKELAAKVSLSTTPVFERVKRLEKEGVIRRYIAVLDSEKLNKGFVVFCSVKMNRLGKDIAESFMKKIADIPEVTECYNISGRPVTRPILTAPSSDAMRGRSSIPSASARA